MNADYDFKFSQPSSANHIEFEFNLSKSDHVEQKSQIKVGAQFYSIIPKNPEDLGAIKGLLEKSIRENKIQTIEDLKRHITLVSSSTNTNTSQVNSVCVSILSGNSLKGRIPQTVHTLAHELRDKYVFPEIGEECAAYIEQQLQEGAYDGISDPEVFVSVLTTDLRSISSDKHVFVGIKPQNNAKPSTQVDKANEVDYTDYPLLPRLVKENIKAYIAPTNIGWMGEPMGSMPYEYKSGFLDTDPSIGYFDLRKFGICNGETDYAKECYRDFFANISSENKASKTVEIEDVNASGIKDANARRQAYIEAIANLKSAKSIIIDMRFNSGGDPSAVQMLCSLFMEEQLPLSRIEWRTPNGTKSDNFLTLSEKELPSNMRLKDTPLYILTSPWTFSAGEEFCNNMKVYSRATVVGELTGGGANPGNVLSLNDTFDAFIPSGRAVNPIQEGNWEGIGIVPDHYISNEQALDAAITLIHTNIKR
ncbi:MAG: S41 family peptidase [Chlamydiales bacterium]|nr:S41 family peptidase [Chlamydiales bacterium]